MVWLCGFSGLVVGLFWCVMVCTLGFRLVFGFWLGGYVENHVKICEKSRKIGIFGFLK